LNPLENTTMPTAPRRSDWMALALLAVLLAAIFLVVRHERNPLHSLPPRQDAIATPHSPAK